jgi:hypothetical protein
MTCSTASRRGGSTSSATSSGSGRTERQQHQSPNSAHSGGFVFAVRTARAAVYLETDSFYQWPRPFDDRPATACFMDGEGLGDR